MRIPLLLTSIFLISAASARAACDLSISRSGTYLGGFAFGTLKIGEIYGLKTAEHEWVVVDSLWTDAEVPERDYTYFLGQVCERSRFAGIEAGNRHARDCFSFGCRQMTNWYWKGGAEFMACDGFSRLQPLSQLRVSRPARNQVRIVLEDLPSEASMAVETSTDLKTWRAAATVAADGSNINLMLLNTGRSVVCRARFPHL